MVDITLKGTNQDMGKISIDYSKVAERVRKCKQDKMNQNCRRELQESGIDFED